MVTSMFETLRTIVQAVNSAANLQQALEITVQRVKEAMHAETASIYFRDGDSAQLVLMAADGLNPDYIGTIRVEDGKGLVGLVVERAEPVNLEDAPAHPRYLNLIDTDETSFHGFLGVPLIQHREVLGVLVVRRRAQRRFEPNDEAFLVTLAAQLAGAINNAEKSGEAARLIEEVSGDISFNLTGVAGSPGLAIGTAKVIFPLADLNAIPDHPISREEALEEERLFRTAVAQVEADLQEFSRRMTNVLPSEDLALFDAFSLMLSSETLIDPVVARIQAGNWAAGALRETIEEHVQLFQQMEDPYLRERAADVRDLGQRILTYIQSEQPETLSVTAPTILVGEEISATQLAEIPPAHLLGVVSARGSSTSHVAILAHALGIPAVMGIGNLPAAQLDGQQLIIDGYRGKVHVRPSATMLEEFERLVAEEAELREGLEKLGGLPAETPDGYRMPLYVNTGLLADISPSLRSGADGVGLYRTEIPFMIRERFPAEAEQQRIYSEVLNGFAPLPVVLRTLDIGGDKPLPYFPVEEDNPFLGWRGIRLMLDHPEIFLTQIRAMLAASREANNLSIMLPMIADVQEVDEAVDLIERAREELREEGVLVGRPRIGVMIEVPSAVYQIPALAQRVDFFSIGTNDLTQYLLAVDRNNAQVAGLYDSLHPAVLKAVQQVVEQAHASDRLVSVCGEMAGDPAAAIILLGLGVDSLSMSVGSLHRVKWVIRTFARQQARRLAEQALSMSGVASIKALLNQALEEAGLGGLIRAGK